MEGGVGGGLGSRYAGSKKPAYPRPGRAEKILGILAAYPPLPESIWVSEWNCFSTGIWKYFCNFSPAASYEPYILSFVWSNTSVVSMIVSGISNLSGSRYKLRTTCFFLGKYRFYCYNEWIVLYCTAVKRRFILSELKRSWYPWPPPGVGYGTITEEFLGSWRWVDRG